MYVLYCTTNVYILYYIYIYNAKYVYIFANNTQADTSISESIVLNQTEMGYRKYTLFRLIFNHTEYRLQSKFGVFIKIEKLVSLYVT